MLGPHAGRHLVIAAALLAAGFFGAYLRFLPYLEREATYTDGQRSMALRDVQRLRFAVWDEPAPLPPAVNTAAAESRPTISPDGRVLVFALGEPGLNAELWMAEIRDGEPRDPRPLAALNTGADEIAPAFGHDALYFASNRGGGRGGFDLYRAAWRDGVPGPVESLGPALNGEADELDPAPLPGTRALAFASNRARGTQRDHDLYLAVPDDASRDLQATADDAARDPGAAGAGWDVRPFAALNTAFHEREPCFTADGSGVVFASNRRAGADFDLYRSVQSLGVWQPPEVVAGLDSPDDERGPHLADDGFALLLSVAPIDAGGAAGPPDLHRARSLELFRLPGRPVGWLDLTILALLLLVALLAWLGKRWEALDVLYKCLLVSLAIHVALMLWFRDVVVEPEPIELGERGRTFQVRLAPSQQAIARARERSGRLERAPAPADDGASDPTRAQLALPSHAAQLAALPAPAGAALPEPVVPQRGAPAHAAADVQPSARADAALAALDVRDATSPLPTRTGGARALTIAPRDGRERRADRGDAEPTHRATDLPPSDVARAAAPEITALSVPAVSSPSSAALPPAAPAAELAADARRAGELPPVAVAMPRAEAPAPGAPVAERDGAASGGETLLDLSTLAQRTTRTPQGPDAHAPAPVRRTGTLPGEVLVATHVAAPVPGQTTLPALPALEDALARRPFEDGPDAPVARAELSPSRGSPADVALRDRAPEDRAPQGIADARDARDARDTDGGGNAAAADVAASTPTDAAAARDLIADLALAPRSARAREATAAPSPRRWERDTAPAVLAPRPRELVLAAAPEAAPAAPDTTPQRWEHTPYRTRFGEAKIRALAEHGGSEQTEEAVAAGLRYLARMQGGEGHWGSTDDYDDKYGHVAVGKSALCLLAFLGAGHTPASGTEHSAVTARAIDFLLAVQGEEGHFGYTTSYSHGVTTYALAECYALTGEARLRAPLERAVAWIVKHQHRDRDPRRFGGWGYYYPDGRTFDPWPRTSVTAWQVMALESARLGGLAVPDRAFSDARAFLLASHRGDEGVVLYSHDPERLRSSYWTLPGSTPAGLFALSLLGEDVRTSRYTSAVRYVTDRAPAGFRQASQEAFVSRAAGNVYFWYYGSLVLFRHGGEPWDRWNEHLQATLLPSQQDDGSWRPISHYATYAGDGPDDRSYTTAMCVLTLEVYYRYFTPLLRVP